MSDADNGGRLTWRPLAVTDFPLLGRWLADPDVARWWNHDPSPDGVQRDFGGSVRGEEPGEDLIVLLDDRPIGLVQRSVISDYPDELAEFDSILSIPEGAVQLDYLIGEAGLRGHGVGPRIIAALVKDTWRSYPRASAVIVAVVAANRRSWRALDKAGLRRVAEGNISPDNPADGPLHYIYRADRPQSG